MNIDDLVAESEDDFTKYFKRLGYDVSWDFSASTGERWWELSIDGGMIQIDQGVPLADVLEDLKCLKNGKTPTSTSDYKISTDHENMSKFLAALPI